MSISINMNLSPDWVQTFAKAGIVSVHRSMIGDIRATDRASNDYIVFTRDLNFGALLAATQAESPSAIQVRMQDPLLHAIGDLVTSSLRQFQPELEIGALVSIDVNCSRVRILPIGRS